jgi:hypothetical protein
LSDSKKKPQSISEKENQKGYCLGTVIGKAMSYRVFKPGSGVHQLYYTLAPTGSHLMQQMQNILL